MEALTIALLVAVVAAIGFGIWGSSERRRRIEAEVEEGRVTRDSSKLRRELREQGEAHAKDVTVLNRDKQHALNVLDEYRQFVNAFHGEHVPHLEAVFTRRTIPQPDRLVKDAVMGLALIDDAQDDSRLIRLVNDLRGTPKEQ